MHGSLRALLGSGNLNSGPYAWIAHNSYTDLAPWPHVSLFIMFDHIFCYFWTFIIFVNVFQFCPILISISVSSTFSRKNCHYIVCSGSNKKFLNFFVFRLMQ